MNGLVHCGVCDEPAVDGIETVNGVQFYCREHLGRSGAKLLADIVRDLAEYGQRYERSQDPRSLPCQMCSGVWGDHQQSCPWRRAVEAMR